MGLRVHVRVTRPIFLHVPRTGGTSIRESWRPLMRYPELWFHHLPPPEVLSTSDFVYGFTRNPWDRVVSLWHLFCPHLDFTRWVEAGLPTGVGRYPVAAPSVWWLRHATWVGRFETRDVDVAKLAALLDRPVPQRHDNRSVRRPYADYYTATTEAIVRAMFAEDVEHFGYRFEE